jgi:ECF sigma factor
MANLQSLFKKPGGATAERHFAGLTGDQAAALLGTSPRSADRQWAYTWAWLRRELDKGAGP